MKATIKIKKKVDVKYLKIDAGVRYWEDGKVNDKEDDPSKPSMPFAVFCKKDDEKGIYLDCYRWQLSIDVENGDIIGWPEGVSASTCYKVCDDGTYSLLDKNKKVIKEVDSYVPDCLGSYGDYIELNIDSSGHIENWHFTEEDIQDIIKGDFNYENN